MQQAAVFDPISVKPETTLKEAADLMLRWHVGGLPVADDQNRLLGMITYTDLLREYVRRRKHQQIFARGRCIKLRQGSKTWLNQRCFSYETEVEWKKERGTDPRTEPASSHCRSSARIQGT